jgi:8-oxo-dGTP diphosphatase
VSEGIQPQVPETILTEVAAGILIAAGSVLLCHRHPSRRSYPDVWDFPGGHVDEGETPQSALIRELQEELGIKAIVPPQVWRVLDGAGQYRLHLFLVRQWSGEIVNADTNEHDDLAWFEEAEVHALKLAHDSYRELIPDAFRTP